LQDIELAGISQRVIRVLLTTVCPLTDAARVRLGSKGDMARLIQTTSSAPTWKLRGKAILIESKDDIKKRLDASTDDGDAVILAWHKREDAAARHAPREEAAARNNFAGGWMG
jgi:hypothetical protein